jgi:hypothetical protein
MTRIALDWMVKITPRLVKKIVQDHLQSTP